MIGALWKALRQLLGLASTAKEVIDVARDVAQEVAPKKPPPRRREPPRLLSPRPPPLPSPVPKPPMPPAKRLK